MENIKLNKSAERVVDVLFLLSKSEKALTLNEICKALSLPKSSAFELLQTLVFKGFLEIEDARLKTYNLGLGAFETGISYLSKMSVSQLARPLLQELNRQTGSTVFLGVEDKGKIVYLDKAENFSVVRATAKLGSRRFMHTTGLGKALLAALDDERIHYILGNDELLSKTIHSKVTIQDVLKDIQETRARGYSIDNREDNIETYCIGSAIYDQWSQPIAAISVASMYSTMNTEREKTIVTLVQDTALKLSQQLGYGGRQLYAN
ncbi:IclR family transcriptional regulator [Marinomonas algicola]|uniref:IclR family transcriptional regulator n=1 Tax=Marinomonas algicola TaxID=2773454 RepID=UPI00174C1909|nr:IclR family transcriptional regulator [Marinomonas algicola]